MIRIWLLLAAVRFETSTVSSWEIMLPFLLHLPRRSSKKNPHVSFLISPNLRFPQKLQYQCFTNHSGVFDFLSLHPAFSESFSRLWLNSLSSSKHLIPLSLVTRLIIFNPLIFHFLLPTFCHFSCMSILSSVSLSFIPICFRSNFTFPQLCPWDNLLYLTYE